MDFRICHLLILFLRKSGKHDCWNDCSRLQTNLPKSSVVIGTRKQFFIKNKITFLIIFKQFLVHTTKGQIILNTFILNHWKKKNVIFLYSSFSSLVPNWRWHRSISRILTSQQSFKLFIILISSLFLSWSFLPKLCLILETIFCCNSFVLELFSKNFYLKGKGKTISFKAKESKTKLEKEREPSKLIAIIL